MCRYLNYFKYFLIFVSAISGCASNSAFASLVGIPVGTGSSVIELTIWAVTVGIKKKSVIQSSRKKEKHNKIQSKILFLKP